MTKAEFEAERDQLAIAHDLDPETWARGSAQQIAINIYKAGYTAGALHSGPVNILGVALKMISEFDLPATASAQEHMVAWCSMTAKAKEALAELAKLRSEK